MIKSLFTAIFCLIAASAFSYNAPLGTKIGHYTNSFDKVYALGANYLLQAPAGSNCVTFVFKMNIRSGDHGGILSVRRRSLGIRYLSVDFDNSGRLIISRPFSNYEMVGYKIYDEMLDYSSSASKEYEFRIFFCENFIWIEVTNSSNTVVTPIFWGGNLPGANVIERVLNRDSDCEIVFGDDNNAGPTLVHTALEVYASKYVDLKNDIINRYIPTTQTRATVTTDIQDNKSSNYEVSLYPLPVDEKLNVDFYTTEAGKVDFEIYSMQGTLLYKRRKNYSSPGHNHEVFLKNEISNGINIAILLIRFQDKVVSRKILFK